MIELIDLISSVCLVLLLGAQIFLRSWFLRIIKFILPILVVIFLTFPSYSSYMQYVSWATGPLSKLFLPPHTNISYFLGYVGTRFFVPWLVALLAAIILPNIANYYNRKYGERFFETEEIQIFALCIFLTGYPGFLFYLVLLMFLGTLFSIGYTIMHKGRLPLYYLWVPIAICAIIIKLYLLLRFPYFLSLFVI